MTSADGRVICLNKHVCVIGSQPPVHLPLTSSMVSRAHALIINDVDGVYVRDLASRNRLYLNGRQVRESRLGNADTLRIGPFTLLCRNGFPPRGVEGLPDGAGRPSRGGPPPRAAEAELWLLDGEGHTAVALTSRTVLIGRRNGCDLLLSSLTVSPVHAVIFERAGRRFVRDLNSSLGTWVNGRQVREVELRRGDEIRLGMVRLRYQPRGSDAEEIAWADAPTQPAESAWPSDPSASADATEGLEATGHLPIRQLPSAASADLAASGDLTAPVALTAAARQEESLPERATVADLFEGSLEDALRIGPRPQASPQQQPAPETYAAVGGFPSEGWVSFASPADPFVPELRPESAARSEHVQPTVAPGAPSGGPAREWTTLRWVCRLFGRRHSPRPPIRQHVNGLDPAKALEVPRC
jgi:pSer/pThr/pTyr-binding forkhead associated (FHA) protein